MNGMFNNYNNFVSLGYFCGVAGDLEKMGLRNMSSPFDWCMSDFRGVMRAIDEKFEHFLEEDTLIQDRTQRNHYLNPEYGIWFYHDLSEYKSLHEQFQSVQEKYQRRIERFLHNIHSPTLFIRYISNKETCGETV